MARNRTYNRRNILIVLSVILLVTCILTGRLVYLMIFKSEYYSAKAKALHERERPIKAKRGSIYDINGVELATNKPVCTISVIHSQITDPEKVISVLSEHLGLSEEYVRKRVEKVSAIERIKSNVSKEIADKIREYKLDGVMVDEDYKRYYPYGNLASKVIGFTGSDNQGVIGLEVKYEDYLKGINGMILTLTTAYGVEIPNAAEDRVEPQPGNDLYISLDINIQKYAQQAAYKVMEAKSAKNVKLIVMDPRDGKIYAMVNAPEFDLNDPYTLINEIAKDYVGETLSDEKLNELLNQMWRNASISDTYEPGSAFKIITATAALEENEVKLEDRFFCPGFKTVEDRIIRCHKAGGHGSQNFVEGIKNSCNPVFIEIGARLGAERMYDYFKRLGLFNRTGVDIPGEANSIMHNIDNVGAVELATMSFGQSFQITPLQLLVAVSAVINGGKLVTPHFGLQIKAPDGRVIKTLEYKTTENVISKETSETMKKLLEAVVSDGTGKRAYLPGFRVGGKTATSEKLPRRSGKYISSFVGFAPADDPQVIAIVLIDEPVGIYYGGTIAAPVIAELFDNILPYLGIEERYTEEEQKEYKVGTFTVPDFIGKTKKEMKDLLRVYEFGEIYTLGEGDIVIEQFPLPGEIVNKYSPLVLYYQ
ncbi:stage V sporulation protein D (sporulation-specific penicillin-binding protein) [Herbinix hemicellulosilytica]|uniref:Putative membrane protein n=1 Tax=Herbinix hemicellulosilytica TaxID=1564487 RepID=A0A0H5SGR3_HERHM|nr:penicillin-binding transpeptidase domain-containing protein [Herbinix hemicellulosilytica]RBP56791.1 stage V sporulation protein D (sporulation-specific penicillin-binding protein) [Herbinix hemicellulosilytica]CRZ34649.1 putative membrane protein [Herbinix hemicellulosilytica]